MIFVRLLVRPLPVFSAITHSLKRIDCWRSEFYHNEISDVITVKKTVTSTIRFENSESLRTAPTCGQVRSEFKNLPSRCPAGSFVTSLFTNYFNLTLPYSSWQSFVHCDDRNFSKIMQNGRALFMLSTVGRLRGQEIGFEQKHSDYNAKKLFIYSRHTVVIPETMSHFDNHFDSGKLYFRK